MDLATLENKGQGEGRIGKQRNKKRCARTEQQQYFESNARLNFPTEERRKCV